MTGRYKHALTAEELAALPDSEINYSDIAKLDKAFWLRAEVKPPLTKAEHLNPTPRSRTQIKRP